MKPVKARRRSGGHAARVQKRTAKQLPASARFIRKIPTYELLDEEALQRLEDHANWILKEIGIEFRGDDEALQLFRDAGASVTGCRVRFDTGHTQVLCSTAPESFVMEGRDPARSIILGGDHVVLMVI